MLLLLILGWRGPGHQRKIKSHRIAEECPRKVILPLVRQGANKQLSEQLSPRRWGKVTTCLLCMGKLGWRVSYLAVQMLSVNLIALIVFCGLIVLLNDIWQNKAIINKTNEKNQHISILLFKMPYQKDQISKRVNIYEKSHLNP